MAIVKTLSSDDFVSEFKSSYRKDQFSIPALYALYDYLDNLSEDIGIPIELDIIAICCEYTEYPSAIEAVNAYTEDVPYLLDQEEMEDIDLLELQEKQTEKAIEWLEDRTSVISFEGGIIIQDF